MIPYIGATGITDAKQTKMLLSNVPHGSSHHLMVGVLASSKTIAGMANRWPMRYPKVERIGNVFKKDSRSLNLIHYSTDEQQTLFNQLLHLKEIGGPNLHGFQLNFAWPNISALEEYRKDNPGSYIVLQIGGRAMAKAGSPKSVAAMLGPYNPFIDSILIDASGGYGKTLDPIEARNYLHEIASTGYSFGLGLAGGLGLHSLSIVEPFLREFPDLSIDAEGKLRNERTDKLDLYLAAMYVKNAFRMVEEIADAERH